MSLHGMSDGMKQTFSKTSGRKCCEGKKKEWTEDALRTTYQQEYYEKEAARSLAMERLHLIAAPKEKHKFDDSTTYGGDFKQYEAGRRELIKPAGQEQENAPFQGQSTYASNYDQKASTYKRVKPENTLAPSAGAFEGQSTNKLDYKHWGVPRPRTAMVQSNVATNTAPFAGQSLYNETFKRYPYSKREPAFKGKDSDDAYPKGPLESDTVYRAAYTGKAVEAPVRHKPVDSAVQNLGWYDGVPTTEYGKQFFEKAGAPAKPAESGNGQRPFPVGPFEGKTNYNSDFQQRELGDRAKSQRPQGAETEKLPFTGASTYNDAFLKRDAPHYERVKAKNTYEPNPAQFEGLSTNKADFKQWEGQPYVRKGPAASTMQSAGKFDGRSTYNGDFQRLQGKPAGLLRPAREAVSAGVFDATTTYRKDFVEKEAERWPVRPSSVCSSCAAGGVER